MPSLRTRSVRSWCGVGLLFVLGAAAARTEGEAPAVRLRTLAREPVMGSLLALGPQEVTVATARGPRRIPLGEVRSLDHLGATAPTLRNAAHLRLHLVGGEVVVGRFAGSVPDGLVLDTPDVGPLALRFEAIRTLVPVPAEAGVCYEPEFRHRPAEEDVAYATSGDAYEGIVVKATDEGLEVETGRGRTRAIAWTALLVLHLRNEQPPAPEGRVVEIETVEGARLVAAGPVALAEESAVFALRSLPEREVRLPLHRLQTLRTRGGAFTYASDLPFESLFVSYYQDDAEEASFLERWFATRTDRRPSGCPLRLDGTTYRHGFAVHARSTIRIALDGSYARFESLFGVDDEAADVEAGGIVDARVLGDGKVLWSARDVRVGEAPRRVGPLDVSSVAELVLEVDFGAELHVRDRAVWADPILVRK